MKPLCLGAVLHLPYWLLRLDALLANPFSIFLLALLLFDLPSAFLLCVSLSLQEVTLISPSLPLGF